MSKEIPLSQKYKGRLPKDIPTEVIDNLPEEVILDIIRVNEKNFKKEHPNALTEDEVIESTLKEMNIENKPITDGEINDESLENSSLEDLVEDIINDEKDEEETPERSTVKEDSEEESTKDESNESNEKTKRPKINISIPDKKEPKQEVNDKKVVEVNSIDDPDIDLPEEIVNTIVNKKQEDSVQENTQEEIESPIQEVSPEIDSSEEEDIETHKRSFERVTDIPVTSANQLDVITSFNNNYLKKVKATYFVALPISGYSVNVRGLTVRELDAITASFYSPDVLKEKLWEIAHSCIETCSAGKLSYQEFRKRTAATELKLIFYGISIMTFGKERSIQFNCNSCKETNKKKIDLNKAIDVKSDKIKGIINALNNDKDLYLASNAILFNKEKIKLPDSNIVLELSIPSIEKEERISKLFVESNLTDNNVTLFTLVSIIDKMFIPLYKPDGSFDVYSELVDKKSIINIVNNLTKSDREAIKEFIKETYDNLSVDITVKVKCSKCQADNTVDIDVMENFITAVLAEI
jgi:hypothetical protein